MKKNELQENECCPPFHPESWDEINIDWTNKRFIKDKAFTFFYMPVNFGSAMRRLNKLTEAAGAQVPESLCLSDHSSPWKMDLLLAVDKIIPNATNIALSGKYFSKVYEGPYNNAGKWQIDFKNLVENKGLSMGKTYLWYTTCPKCAKKYGKNYTVIIGKTGN